MKRILFVAAAGLALGIVSPSGAWAFGVKDVVAMSRDGIADSLIVQKIQHGGTVFHLDAGDLHRLKTAGVSDGVVSAMLRTEDTADAYPAFDVYPWWPYGAPWYFGLDFRYEAPFYTRRFARDVGAGGFDHRGFGGGGRGFHHR